VKKFSAKTPDGERITPVCYELLGFPVDSLRQEQQHVSEVVNGY
jgi:hypothetical protein